MPLVIADKGHRQKAVLSYINDAYSSKNERKAAKNFMKSIWKKYPVEWKEIDNVIHIRFKTSAYNYHSYGVDLTSDELNKLAEISTKINVYMNNLDRKGDQRCLSDQHYDITYDSLLKVLNGETMYANMAALSSREPDNWPADDFKPLIPSWIPEPIRSKIINYFECYPHAYDHGYFHFFYNIDDIKFILGIAPTHVKEECAKAHTAHDNHDLVTMFKRLGYASHFMEDVGIPLHTGALLNQAMYSVDFNISTFSLNVNSNEWVHHAYEDYINDNWDNGYKFHDIEKNNVYSPGKERDSEQMAVELADYSSQYSSMVFFTIYYNKDNKDYYMNDTVLKTITENVVRETSTKEMRMLRHETL